MIDTFYVNNDFKNVTLPKHFHEEYTISLVYSGKHLFENENDKYKIVPGIIQVVNPYEIHATDNSTWSHINIMPTTQLVKSIASDIMQKEINERIYFNSYTNDEFASYLFITMFDKFKDKNRMQMDNSLIEFLDYMLRNHSSINENEIINQSLNKKDFSSTIDFIDSNLNDVDLSLEKLSLNAGLSKFHFSREFKKHYKVSPANFIQIKRVNKIRQSLKKNLSLSEIAYECGFSDQSYMIKVFKKYTGYTPSKVQSL